MFFWQIELEMAPLDDFVLRVNVSDELLARMLVYFALMDISAALVRSALYSVLPQACEAGEANQTKKCTVKCANKQSDLPGRRKANRNKQANMAICKSKANKYGEMRKQNKKIL